jgi:AcrR family transcriptional regulator
MPRFTDAEQRRIRARLLESGHDRFVADGLEETTIAELTDDAGIAAGTFYSFFDSKEDLFAVVLRREADRVYEDLREVLAAHDHDPETAIRRFLEVASAAVVENPLFRRVVSRAERERLRGALPAAELAATRSEKLSLLTPYIEEWQRRGLAVEGDPETVALAVLYVSSLPLHREEIGTDRYPQVRDLLFGWAAASVARE